MTMDTNMAIYTHVSSNYTHICPIIGHFLGVLGSDLSRGSPLPPMRKKVAMVGCFILSIHNTNEIH